MIVLRTALLTAGCLCALAAKAQDAAPQGGDQSQFFVPPELVAAPQSPDPDPIQTFDDAARTQIPLTPDELVKFRRMIEDTDRASRQPLRPSEAQVRSVNVSMDPGTAPPAINTRKGYSTSLVFLDATGAPWPLFSATVGDKGAFNVEQVGDATLIVQCLIPESTSNLIVALKGVPTPLVWQLTPNDNAIDFRVNALMPVPGPLSESTPSDPGPMIGGPGSTLINDAEMTAFMDDTPPGEAVRAPVVGDPTTRVWLYKGKMIVRTRHMLMAPRARQQQSGPNRYAVYVIEKPSPALTILRDGSTALLTVAIDTQARVAASQWSP